MTRKIPPQKRRLSDLFKSQLDEVSHAMEGVMGILDRMASDYQDLGDFPMANQNSAIKGLINDLSQLLSPLNLSADLQSTLCQPQVGLSLSEAHTVMRELNASLIIDGNSPIDQLRVQLPAIGANEAKLELQSRLNMTCD